MPELDKEKISQTKEILGRDYDASMKLARELVSVWGIMSMFPGENSDDKNELVKFLEENFKVVFPEFDEFKNYIAPYQQKIEKEILAKNVGAVGILVAASNPIVLGLLMGSAGMAAVLSSATIRAKLSEISDKTAKKLKEQVDKWKRWRQRKNSPRGGKPWLGDAIKAGLYSATILGVSLSEGGQTLLKKAPETASNITKYLVIGIIGVVGLYAFMEYQR